MKKLIFPPKLKRGSRAAVVSLSMGWLGDEAFESNRKRGFERLRQLGLDTVFMPNVMRGSGYLHDHPEARADDLKAAFADDSIDIIISAIGGDDTYRLLPYLMDDEEFGRNVREHPKIFIGYSDTTVNHLMFYKLGLGTFYAPSFIGNFDELADEMLPYTKAAVEGLFDGRELREIRPAPIWYEERKDFSPAQTGAPRIAHEETHGFELLQGKEGFSGELLGGCIESMTDLLTGERYADEREIAERYRIFPDLDEWRGKVLFIETSEEKMTPEAYEKALNVLKDRGIFGVINGIIVGKPQDEVFYEEYKSVLVRVIDEPDLPILYNINFGHAYPKTVLPYGRRAVCYKDKIITE